MKYWYTSGCGRIEILMTMDQAHGASHSGSCDADVAALSRRPEIKRQLAAIDPAVLREEIRGYGAWDDEELADHEQNLQRFLWTSAGHISDGDGYIDYEPAQFELPL